MGWTTPRTWSIGEFETKAIFDTHVRDNLNALKPAYAAVSMSAAQTHTSNGNYQTANWDAEDIDSDGFHDNVTNNSRLTVPSGLGGVYYVFASIMYSAAGAGLTPGVKFQKNGADLFGLRAAAGAVPVGASTSTLVTLAATDYVTVMGYQSSGGNASYGVGSSGEACRFGMYRVFGP